MEEDILNQVPVKKEIKPKHTFSVLTIIFTIILTILLIILGERFLFDLNRWFNPVVTKGYSTQIRDLVESKTLGFGSVFYPQRRHDEYKMYQLLIHSAFILPLILIIFLFYFQWHKEKKKIKPLMISFLITGFWFLLRLVFQSIAFVLLRFKGSWIYVVLILLIIILSLLIILSQKLKPEEKIK